MGTYFLWGGLAVLVIFLGLGFLMGAWRGLKRSFLHIIIVILSIMVAYFLTKPVTNALLGISFSIDGESFTVGKYIIQLISESFDLSQYTSVSEFIESLPSAIVSPIVFIFMALIVYLVFEIIYLIISRFSFGKKKEYMSKHKPHKLFGGMIGLVEGFIFMIVLFSPFTALTNFYQDLTVSSSQSVEVSAQSEEDSSQGLKYLSEYINELVPQSVADVISSYNNSFFGKLTNFGGLSNVMFDGLVNVSINDEKIVIRTEILNIVDIYNSVVDIYNQYSDLGIDSVNLSNLKGYVETFTNNGLFKAVIVPTLVDYISNYAVDVSASDESDLSKVIEDIIVDLKTAIKAEDFDGYTYFSHDILQILDVADEVISSKIVSQINELEEGDLVEILNVVNENSQSVSTILKGVVNLNLFKDCTTTLISYANTFVEDFFENDEDLIIALNTNLTDLEQTVDDIFAVLDEFVELSNQIDISEIFNNQEDIFEIFSNVEDLSTTLDSLGTIFDNIRELELLTPEISGDKTYVFDNILKYFNISLLGDEVQTGSGQEVLDTYSKFFNFIKEPVVQVVELGLLEAEDFDTVLDNIMEMLKDNENLFADLLMPFYQLQNATFDGETSIKEMVFDTMINSLKESISEDTFSFDDIEDTYESWYKELQLLGETLNALNSGEIEGMTYFEYIRQESYDLNTLLKEMLNESDEDVFANVMNPLLESKIFSPLVESIFAEIDSQIAELTGVDPNTDLTNLVATKDGVIETIRQLLTITLEVEDMSDLDLTTIGEILDILKDNAKSSTDENEKYDGVFNNIFVNLIWYLTDDDISAEEVYSGETNSNENTTEIKALLAGGSETVNYYEIDFASVMADVEEVVNFAESLLEKLEDISISSESDITTFVEKLQEAVNSITADDQAEIIGKLAQIVDQCGDKYVFISGETLTTYNDTIVEKIEETFTNTGVATALINLLGLTSQE